MSNIEWPDPASLDEETVTIATRVFKGGARIGAYIKMAEGYDFTVNKNPSDNQPCQLIAHFNNITGDFSLQRKTGKLLETVSITSETAEPPTHKTILNFMNYWQIAAEVDTGMSGKTPSCADDKNFAPLLKLKP